jgi:hypothetical protein
MQVSASQLKQSGVGVEKSDENHERQRLCRAEGEQI